MQVNTVVDVKFHPNLQFLSQKVWAIWQATPVNWKLHLPLPQLLTNNQHSPMPSNPETNPTNYNYPYQEILY